MKKLSIMQNFSEATFLDEINCLIKAKHTNIVRFLGYCADTYGECVQYEGSLVLSEVPQRLLCFEYVPNGNLQKYLNGKACIFSFASFQKKCNTNTTRNTTRRYKDESK